MFARSASTSSASQWLEGIVFPNSRANRVSRDSSAYDVPSSPTTAGARTAHGASPVPSSSDTSSSSMATNPSSQGPITPNSPLDNSVRFADPAQHPYAHLAASSNIMMRDHSEQSADCPVCLESLSMRLQGEKPHITPICGHRLHEACFEAVYGSVSVAKTKARTGMRGQSVGLCGVCRRDMKLGETSEAGNRRDKFAVISGIQPTADEFKVRSISKRTIPAVDLPHALHDPADDDAIPVSSPSHSPSIGRSTSSRALVPVVQPIITVHSETPSIARPADTQSKTRVTTLVTIEIPSRLGGTAESAETLIREAGHQRMPSIDEMASESNVETTHSRSTPRSPRDRDAATLNGHPYTRPTMKPLVPTPEESEHLSGALADLQMRMTDWKGHEPHQFGQLKLFDCLRVAKENTSRLFQVYLFEEALLCVADDRKRSNSGRPVEGSSTDLDEKLRLKGRVFVRHVRQVDHIEELTLAVTMADDSLEGFTIHFDDVEQLQTWKTHLTFLIARLRGGQSVSRQPTLPSRPSTSSDLRNKVSHPSFRDSVLSTSHSDRSIQSDSAYSRSSGLAHPITVSSMKTNGKLQQNGVHHTSQINTSGPVRAIAPSMTLPGLDLVVILSMSPEIGAPSAGPLKMRLLRNTVEFLVTSGRIGPQARVAVITYTAGDGLRGMLRKTALLSVQGSAERLMSAVGELGSDSAVEDGRELRVVYHADDRVTVVTAVNLALDIILQRTQKAPLTGIVLVNDGKDGTIKQQMDLVMARADHAGVPVHCFGWGRAHDPSSLWLLSNHTGGSYTFVREWYGLREAIAGCVGAMLSIAAANVRLHISVPEKRWFSIRKVAGVQHSVVASDGKDADIELGEMRAGEKREMLVEVEMDSLGGQRDSVMLPARDTCRTDNMTATDEYFMNKVGLDTLSLAGDNIYDNEYGSLMDDVPLFEVNASFRDPLAAKFVSRLPMPIVLSVTIKPAAIASNGESPSPDTRVVRRRIELLCSDMMTRCLLLMSRRNPAQALRLLTETRRIVRTVLSSLGSSDLTADAPFVERSPDAPSIDADSLLQGYLEDIDHIMEGVRAATELSHDGPTKRPYAFDSNHRNFAAQQAVILRDQRAWTDRTSTEKAYFTADMAKNLAKQSADWLAH